MGKLGFWQILALVGLMAGLAACGQPNSARNQINAQNAADYQAKANDLHQMEGTFQGNVHLKQSGEDFDCQMFLKVSSEIQNSTDPSEPSETVPIARLEGGVIFPALQSQQGEELGDTDAVGFLPLYEETDFQKSLRIVHGDDNPALTSTDAPPVILYYLAHDSETITYGYFSGWIHGDEFTGSWFTDLQGVVATFDMTRVSTFPSAVEGGAPSMPAGTGSSAGTATGSSFGGFFR